MKIGVSETVAMHQKGKLSYHMLPSSFFGFYTPKNYQQTAPTFENWWWVDRYFACGTWHLFRISMGVRGKFSEKPCWRKTTTRLFWNERWDIRDMEKHPFMLGSWGDTSIGSLVNLCTAEGRWNLILITVPYWIQAQLLQGSLYYPFGGNQTIQIYGTFGISLTIMHCLGW